MSKQYLFLDSFSRFKRLWRFDFYFQISCFPAASTLFQMSAAAANSFHWTNKPLLTFHRVIFTLANVGYQNVRSKSEKVPLSEYLIHIVYEVLRNGDTIFNMHHEPDPTISYYLIFPMVYTFMIINIRVYIIHVFYRWLNFEILIEFSCKFLRDLSEISFFITILVRFRRSW